MMGHPQQGTDYCCSTFPSRVMGKSITVSSKSRWRTALRDWVLVLGVIWKIMDFTMTQYDYLNEPYVSSGNLFMEMLELDPGKDIGKALKQLVEKRLAM